MPHVLLVGDPTLDAPWQIDGDLLTLRCDDGYEGLPEKILFAAHAVRRAPGLSKTTHVLKVDDHDAAVDATAFRALARSVAAGGPSWDYVGQRVIRGFQGNRRWHFGKVSADSRWRDAPFTRRADLPSMNRGAAAAGTWRFRGDVAGAAWIVRGGETKDMR